MILVEREWADQDNRKLAQRVKQARLSLRASPFRDSKVIVARRREHRFAAIDLHELTKAVASSDL